MASLNEKRRRKKRNYSSYVRQIRHTSYTFVMSSKRYTPSNQFSKLPQMTSNLCESFFFWIESKICTEKVSIGVNELFPDFLNAGVFNIAKFTFLRLFLHFINFSITICNLQMKESTKFVQFFEWNFCKVTKDSIRKPNFQELITNSIRNPIFKS